MNQEIIKKTINTYYKILLNRDADNTGLFSYVTRVMENSLTLDEVYDDIKNSPEAKNLSVNTTPIKTYTDIRIKGKIISYGYRDCEIRYDKISEFCSNYTRPISILDLGAAEGYFTFRLAEDFDGIFTAVECDPNRKLLATHLKTLQYIRNDAM